MSERPPLAPPPCAGAAWTEVLVRRRWLEARDIVALELAPVRGEALPAFEAGACVDVALPGGAVRPYSLANAPHERGHYLLAVRLDPQGLGGSRALHALRAGDRLHLSRPRNSFPLQGGAIHSVLLAGGVGIAPLLSMAEHLWRHAAPFDLHYGFRAPEQAAFLTRLRQAPFAHRVTSWCSGSGGAGRMDFARILARVPRLSHLYLCGPASLMEAASTAAAQRGWPAERIHREPFDALPGSRE